MQGRQWASISYKTGGKVFDDFEENPIDVGTFQEGVPLAVAKVSLGSTMNMGDYNSARCDVGVELPCYLEELPEALRAAYRLAAQCNNDIVRTARASNKTVGIFPTSLASEVAKKGD